MNEHRKLLSLLLTGAIGNREYRMLSDDLNNREHGNPPDAKPESRAAERRSGTVKP